MQIDLFVHLFNRWRPDQLWVRIIGGCPYHSGGALLLSGQHSEKFQVYPDIEVFSIYSARNFGPSIPKIARNYVAK